MWPLTMSALIFAAALWCLDRFLKVRATERNDQ